MRWPARRHPTGHAGVGVGTGTGLIGALLAELVGPTGHVVSVDIDPFLTDRAGKLHAERGVINLTLVTGDGRAGAAGYGRFDAILAWATPTHIPISWIEQCQIGAVISTPIYIAPIARGVGHLTATVTADQALTDPRLGVAVYVDMGAVVNTNLGLPIFYLDAHADLRDGGVAWLSVAWRDQIDGHDPADALALLTQPAHSEAVVLGETAEASLFKC